FHAVPVGGRRRRAQSGNLHHPRHGRDRRSGCRERSRCGRLFRRSPHQRQRPGQFLRPCILAGPERPAGNAVRAQYDRRCGSAGAATATDEPGRRLCRRDDRQPSAQERSRRAERPDRRRRAGDPLRRAAGQARRLCPRRHHRARLSEPQQFQPAPRHPVRSDRHDQQLYRCQLSGGRRTWRRQHPAR
ncbi:hypothetical protein LTR94_031151, partial [Friedmanniomyces endolithicus]